MKDQSGVAVCGREGSEEKRREKEEEEEMTWNEKIS